MKKICTFLFILLIAGCNSDYDDAALQGRVDDLESRVAKLEELCSQMNTNISSLQTIVAAIQNSESVVSVIPITKETDTVGYTIVFSKGGSVTVYYGYNGVIGDAGQEDSGAIPMIGVKKDADDIYYWTLNGEFIVIDGEKRPVYGLVSGSTSDSVAPRLKLENNDWYVTYDNGRTWERLGSAQGSKDGAMIRDISQDDDFVYVTLDDGEVITIAKEKKFDLVFAQTTDIGYMPGIGAKVNFTLTGDYAGVVVESVGDGGWKSRVCMNSDSEGYVDVTAPDGETTGKVLVFASDKKGYSTVKVLTFVDGVLQISSAQSFNRVDGKAQRLELSLHTNIGEYTVSIPESAETWITVVDTRSGIREDKLILDIAALEEGSRYARLQFLNPDGKVLKSIDIWQSTDFTIKFELISLDEREIRVKSIPTDPDVWYHMGIASAEDFDRYADWHKFVENLISSDGGGLLAIYVGDEEFSTTCTPGTEYVIYGFAYDDSEVRSDISIFRVSSVPLPRNYDVDVSATWAIYNGKALAELYPSVYGEYGDATCVFVFTLTPSNAESVHYWGLLHAARSETMSLPDMLIFDYLESYPSLGWLDSKRGVYRIPEQNIAGPWGFFYVAQDESGAWGELHYEEVLLTEDKYEDPRTAPTDGFDNKKTWAVKSAASVAFPAPIRFSKASFMQVTESFGDF